jgi:hypothetical protein
MMGKSGSNQLLKYAPALIAAMVPLSVGLADQQTKSLTENTYQDNAIVECPSGGGLPCIADFATTTAAVTLITNVSCSFSITTGDQVTFSGLITRENPQGPSFILQPFLVGNYLLVPTPTSAMGINSITNLYVKKGFTPAVVVTTNAGISALGCTISGYHS